MADHYVAAAERVPVDAAGVGLDQLARFGIAQVDPCRAQRKGLIGDQFALPAGVERRGAGFPRPVYFAACSAIELRRGAIIAAALRQAGERLISARIDELFPVRFNADERIGQSEVDVFDAAAGGLEGLAARRAGSVEVEPQQAFE